MSLEQNISDRLIGVRNRFVGRLAEYESDIRHLLTSLNNQGIDKTAFKEIQFLVHKMRGPAKTLGFGDLGDCAGKCEHQLEKVLKVQPDTDERIMAFEFLRELLDQLAATRGGQIETRDADRLAP